MVNKWVGMSIVVLVPVVLWFLLCLWFFATSIILCGVPLGSALIRLRNATVVPGIVLAMMLGVLAVWSQAGLQPRRSKCVENLSTLAKALSMYAMDHGDEYPASFCSLTNYVDDPRCFVCPKTGTKVGAIEAVDQWADYILVTNVTAWSPSSQVLVYCKPGNHHEGINVLFGDAYVTWISKSGYPTLSCDVEAGARVNSMAVITQAQERLN